MFPKIKIIRFFQSPAFKKFTVITGIIFVILTFFIALDPKPFLKFGYAGVFVFNLFGPGALLIPSLSRLMDIYLLSFISALGMAVNDSISWLIGRHGHVILPRSKKILRLEKSLHKYGPFALFFWALIPFPYDLIGLMAGYLEFPFFAFGLPTFFGRFVRFILMGTGTVAIFGRVVM